jgi:hypothetical protein
VTPFSGFNFTGDVYRIRVDDRIVLSNTLAVNASTEAGRRIQQLLAPYGAEAVKYFMNAFHTETAASTSRRATASSSPRTGCSRRR